MKGELPVKFTVLSAALLLLTAGCVRFEYQGESFDAIPGNDTVIYAPGAKVPDGLAVIGTAIVSGDYQDVSRDRLEERLQNEAAARGATAVRLTAIQILPEAAGPVIPVSELSAEAGDLNSTQRDQSLRREFDGGYGTASYNLLGGKVNDPAASARSYRRILRAEFLRPAR